MARSMIHMNDHLLAAISIETTGLQPRFNDLIQVCFLVLDADLKPNKTIIPFYGDMQPKRPHNTDYEALSISKIDYYKLLQKSLDADRMADLFEEWFDRLPLASNKRIMPLAHNWPFICAFLEDWLGFEHMKHFFNPHYRDLQVATLLENDKADHMVTQTPFPKIDLQYTSSCLKVERTRPHNALQDCVVVAECYRRILKSGAAVIRVVDDV